MLNDAGEVTVSGNMDNKVLCYGLLEIARETIQAHHAQAQRRVQPVGELALLGKGNGR